MQHMHFLFFAIDMAKCYTVIALLTSGIQFGRQGVHVLHPRPH